VIKDLPNTVSDKEIMTNTVSRFLFQGFASDSSAVQLSEVSES
jgi:hypothetical protein